MIILEHIAAAVLIVYFLPFFWEQGTAHKWMLGMLASTTTLMLMLRKTPAARFVGLIVFCTASFLPMKFGAELLAAISQLRMPCTMELPFAMGALSLLLGGLYTLLGCRLLVGRREKMYYKIERRPEQGD